ncbi:hypothetical protein D3C87_2122190 [compost metagenome]
MAADINHSCGISSDGGIGNLDGGLFGIVVFVVVEGEAAAAFDSETACDHDADGFYCVGSRLDCH